MKFSDELLNLDYLVYSSHKSGTQTLVRTFSEHGLACKHCHYVKGLGIAKGEFESYLDQYLDANSRKLEVITVFREPLERHASSFFQQYGSRPLRFKEVASKSETIIYNYSIKQLQEKYLLELKSGMLAGYRESLHDICRELRVNIRDFLFNHETGIGRFETRNLKLYMLRFDIFFADPARILTEITGKNIEIMPKNVSSRKWYGSIYSDFKASLVVPQDIALDVYAAKRDLLTLFYPEGEIRSLAL
jgi:hypothetical protein